MADKEQLKRLKEGVEAWNAWREENRGVKLHLSRANLDGADLLNANLSNADLSYASLSRADLRDANLREADLTGADLNKAKLGDANLSGADLNGAELSLAYFGSADLSYAKLNGADLSYAGLSDANLSGADLGYAGLNLADFSNANLSDANLSGADLSDANLSGADLSGAHLDGTKLLSVDLRLSQGLKTVRHPKASEVSISTLAKSEGKIPEVFLKGCGLPDWEIAAAKLHDPGLTSEQVIDLTYEIARIKAESPIQVSPLFISYSHEDADFVNALETQLDKKRIRYWRDIHHATSGPLEEIVDRAMRVNSIVLLILSEHSVNSDWVQWEVKKARKLAKERKAHVLCPIALDGSWKICRWPERLRDQVEEYHILDFSAWEDEDAMGAAFQKLIDGLGIYYPKDVAG